MGPRYKCRWYMCGSWIWIIWGRGHKLDQVSYTSKTRFDILMFFEMGPCMVLVRGCLLKLEVMNHALGVLSSRHSSDMEQYTILFLSCVLHNQLGDHSTSEGGISVGRGYGSFWGRGPHLDLLSYGFETWLDFLMFFDMGPYMVAVRGCILKLEVMDHIMGVLSNYHYGVMEQETKLFLSPVLVQQPGDHATSVADTGVARGYGKFGVGLISTI